VVQKDRFLNPHLARLSKNTVVVLTHNRQLWSFERTFLVHILKMPAVPLALPKHLRENNKDTRPSAPYNEDHVMSVFRTT
jgi:hypothetical protein